MPRIAIGSGLAALVFILIVGDMTPASAEFFGCNDQRSARSVSYRSYQRAPSLRHASRYTHEFAAQSARPHITVRPRVTQPGPNAKRYCRSWLAKEYRVSGPVIVPRMQCWWQ